LHNTLAYIEFEHANPDDVWATLSGTAADGFLAHDATRCFALVLRNERVLYQLSRKKSVAKAYKVTYLDDVRNTGFNGLSRVALKGVRFRKTHISLDGVAPHGRVFGWAHGAEDKPVALLLSIDGEFVETVYPDRFRNDLLGQNIGIGCGGFSLRLPDRYLDGNSHEIKLELYLRNDPYKKIIMQMSKQKKLPFHFNLPRPWITTSAVHAVKWTAEDETKFLDIRENILEHNYANGLLRAGHFIDEKPSAVFRDFGIKDRYKIENLKFESFGKRVTNRWGKLFGENLCALGAGCCKAMKLPYNAMQPKGISADNATMPDTWEKGGFLDQCPLKIRHFASKELTQKYAAQYGIHTPKLYGAIGSIEEFDAFDFPDQYVLKPDFASGIELYLMQGDLNLFDGFRYTKDTIRSRVAHYLATNRSSYFIVEEFLCQDVAQKDQPIIPLDYKIHCFGGRARFVQIVDKNAISRDILHSRQCWLSRDWTHSPFPLRDVTEHPNRPVARPIEYEKMCELADQISSDLGDYIRVDMYATPEGPVLGELSSFTNAGTGFTGYGDTILGQCWEIFDAAPTV
jgi:hypothetical protein